MRVSYDQTNCYMLSTIFYEISVTRKPKIWTFLTQFNTPSMFPLFQQQNSLPFFE